MDSTNHRGGDARGGADAARGRVFPLLADGSFRVGAIRPAVTRPERQSMLRKHRRRAQRRRGMTLVEIMVVLVILGLIGGMVAVAVIPQLEASRRDRAAADI